MVTCHRRTFGVCALVEMVEDGAQKIASEVISSAEKNKNVKPQYTPAPQHTPTPRPYTERKTMKNANNVKNPRTHPPPGTSRTRALARNLPHTPPLTRNLPHSRPRAAFPYRTLQQDLTTMEKTTTKIAAKKKQSAETKKRCERKRT